MTDTNQESQEATTVPEEQVSSPYEELLQQITNEEGKPKYSSVEEALKGNVHAQRHISTLEQENQRYKEETARMEEMLKQFSDNNESQAKTEDNVATTTPSESPKPEESASVPSEDELLERLQARLTEKQKAEQREKNKREALERAQSVYGERTAEVLKEKADALGVDPQWLVSQAEYSPAAFYNLVGVENQRKQSSDFTGSSVNSAALDSTTSKPEFNGNPLTKTQDAVKFWNDYC